MLLSEPQVGTLNHMCWADPADQAKRRESVFYVERLLPNSIAKTSWEEITFCGRKAD